MIVPQEIEDHIKYLQKVVAPDDIYLLTAGLLDQIIYLICLLKENTDIKELLEKEPCLLLLLKQAIDYQKHFNDKDETRLEIKIKRKF